MYFRREDLKEKRRYIDFNFKTLLRVNSVFLIFITFHQLFFTPAGEPGMFSTRQQR